MAAQSTSEVLPTSTTPSQPAQPPRLNTGSTPTTAGQPLL